MNTIWGDGDDNLSAYEKHVDTALFTAHVYAQYDYYGTFLFGWRSEYERDAFDRDTRMAVWADPGGDGLGETTDDVLVVLNTYEYDGAGRIVSEYAFDAYAPAEWLTKSTYAGDILVEERDYVDPGYDGDWGTYDYLGAYRTWAAVDTCAP